MTDEKKCCIMAALGFDVSQKAALATIAVMVVMVLIYKFNK